MRVLGNEKEGMGSGFARYGDIDRSSGVRLRTGCPTCPLIVRGLNRNRIDWQGLSILDKHPLLYC